MKKLMVMLGAVAMSFGLFADGVVTSFEAGEPGVDGTSFTKTTGWSWTGDGALELGTDGASRDLPYTDEGPMARRTFSKSTNANYLKLNTGTDEVSLATGGGSVLDQLVKFTGFDTEPTVENGKIAVWMSEYVDESDEDVTYTNLYVTVGKVTSSAGVESAEPVSIKIKGEFALDTWYRLTIKNVDDIYAGTAGTTPRAGFNVYVDGNQIEADDDEKAACGGLIYNKVDMPANLKADLEAGKLFPAINATDTLFTSVAFKGIGEVDDIYIDAEGPEFCKGVSLAGVTVPAFAKLVKVVDSKSVEFTTFPATVAPGALTIVLKAADGYILKGSGIYNSNTSALEDGVLDMKDLIQPGDIVPSIATITWAGSETTNVASLVEGLAIVQELEAAGEASIEIEICEDGAPVETIPNYGKLGFGKEAAITITPNAWTVSGDMTFAGTVAGTLKVDGTLTIADEGEIKLTGVGTIVTEPGDLDITTDDAGKKVVYDEVAGAYVIVGDITYYTITFTDADTWTNDVQTAAGVTPEPTENVPAVTGKSFAGWNPAVVPAAANATYTAVYTNNFYALTIVPNANATVKVNGAEPVATYEFDTELTIVATANENYEYKADGSYGEWVYDNGTVKITKTMGVNGVTVMVPAPSEKQQDWPDPGTVDPNTPASSKLPGLVGDDLANADLKDLATWAKTYGVEFNAEAVKAAKDAFLLNCDPEEAGAEMAAYNVTAITQDTSGAWVVTPREENTKGAKYYGKSVIQSTASIETPSWTDGETGPFFRTQLRVNQVGK